MKASELIEQLAKHISDVGDKEVVIEYDGSMATAQVEECKVHYHRDQPPDVTINIVGDC